jgi:hypothetical protein
MAACERCWSEYSRRSLTNSRITYADVLREVEESGRVCTSEEQCGEIHLVLQWTDGRPDQCRCGKVVSKAKE